MEELDLKCIDQELFIEDSKDRTRIWKIVVEETDPGVFTMTRTSGLVDGKLKDRLDVYDLDSGKAGRTPQQQAELEARSYIKKQRDKGYAAKDEDTSDRPPVPMKAKDYTPERVQYPVFCQEKLNGICCVAERLDEETVRLTSISGIEFKTLDHLKPELLERMDIGEVFEGQIFRRGLSLQQISSATKKTNPDTPTLQIWIYDAINTKSFDLRLNDIIFDDGEFVISTFTWVFYHQEQADNLYIEVVNAGGEGIMYKNPRGVYKGNLYRSSDVLKRKDFQDAEYEIVGFEFDVDGCVIWKCTVDTRMGPAHFNVVPMGSKESRQIGPEDAELNLGLELTVRYSELSDYGVPQGNPVGITIRDYE